MAIFVCSNCAYTEQTPDNFIGKKARCLKCQTLSTITQEETQPTSELFPDTPATNETVSSPDRNEFSNVELVANKASVDRGAREKWYMITLFALLGCILTVQLIDLGVQNLTTKKWEYTIQSPDDHSLDEELNTLGTSGWELVFARRATNYSGTAKYEMIFRRPK